MLKQRDIILCLKSTYCTYVKNKILKNILWLAYSTQSWIRPLPFEVWFSHTVFSHSIFMNFIIWIMLSSVVQYLVHLTDWGSDVRTTLPLERPSYQVTRNISPDWWIGFLSKMESWQDERKRLCGWRSP